MSQNYAYLSLVVQVRVEPDRARPSGPELDLGRTLGVADGEVDVKLEHAPRVRSLRRAETGAVLHFVITRRSNKGSEVR